MSILPETMFNVGDRPTWSYLGIGTCVKEAPTSADAIRLAGLDWLVESEPMYDQRGREIPNYKLNVRSTDKKVLGVVTTKYKPIQNYEAFAFTDELLGEGVTYETAGALNSGKRIWLLARLERTKLCDENIDPYLCFTSGHDGTGAVRVAITPVRVECMNTLNLALRKASRHWSTIHRGNIQYRIDEARYTLSSANHYMKALEEEFGELKRTKLTDKKVKLMTERVVDTEFDELFKKVLKAKIASVNDVKEYARMQRLEEKLNRKKNAILRIYYDKPDLQNEGFNAFRFINAVSDYAAYTTDHRNTKEYDTNMFLRLNDGHSLIDTAYLLAKAV